MAVAAERDDVRMLDDQELIGNQLLLALFHQIFLDGESLGVAEAAEVAEFAEPRQAVPVSVRH